LVQELNAVYRDGCLKIGAVPVGGRLALFADQWDSDFYRAVLANGFRVRWAKAPPLDFDKGEFKTSSEEEKSLIQEELDSLLLKDAVEEASSSGGHIYRWFLVSKKGTKAKRPVLNMKPGNVHVKYSHFKLEDLKTVKELAQRGDWATRVDLKDAYLHVPVANSDRRFFRFRHRDKVFQWKSLPFGYRDAPRLFQKLMVEAFRTLREQGIRLVIYLDDILILADSRKLCLEHLSMVLQRLISLGFVVNIEKSILEPSQRIQFLGVVVDLIKMSFELPPEKLTCFRRRVKKLLKRAKSKRSLTLLELQSIVGTLISVNDCVWATRVHINSLIEMLRLALVKEDGLVPPSEQTLVDLQWWADNLEVWNGRSMLPTITDEILEVDASDSGLGAIRKTPGRSMEEAFKLLSQEDKRHNNVKELLAVEFGLVHFVNKWNWREKSILIKTDNMTAMSYVNRMGGRISHLCRITERIHGFALKRKLSVRAEWIPGETNVDADRASRIQEDYKESQLNPELFKLVDQWAGPLDRPVCIQEQRSTGQVHLSASSLDQFLFRRSVSPIPKKRRLRKSSIHSDPKGPPESKSGRDRGSDTDRTIMDIASVVAEPDGTSSCSSSSSSSSAQSISGGTGAPITKMGISRLETLRATLEARGLPDAAFNLLLRRYKVRNDQRGGSLYLYESLWRKWLEWCQPSLERAMNFDEDSVAGFLSHMWQQEAAASGVKAAVSVLEVTKRILLPGRRAFLDNGLIRSLIEAVVVDRPVKKRGPKGAVVPFFDVTKIHLYWARQVGNDKLAIDVLRKKAVSLLVVDLFLRCSDLMQFTEAETHFESVAIEGRGQVKSVSFKVTGLKEHRTQHLRWSHFRLACICKDGFAPSCTCCTLERYLHRSKKRRDATPSISQTTSEGSVREVRPLFVTHKNKAKALSKDRLRNDIKDAMGMSGIDEAWTPHSLRGASASKCLNLGLDSKRVLEHGRWTSWQTFKKHYYRIEFVNEASTSHSNLPFWKALRTPTTPVDTTKMGDLENSDKEEGKSE